MRRRVKRSSAELRRGPQRICNDELVPTESFSRDSTSSETERGVSCRSQLLPARRRRTLDTCGRMTEPRVSPRRQCRFPAEARSPDVSDTGHSAQDEAEHPCTLSTMTVSMVCGSNLPKRRLDTWLHWTIPGTEPFVQARRTVDDG